jgi:hypothetical protein
MIALFEIGYYCPAIAISFQFKLEHHHLFDLFLQLPSLKLMDANAFTTSFEQYDLITKRFKLYGKA